MNLSQIPTRNILQVTFLSSLVISAYVIWQDDAINANAYIYLRVAQFFLDGGLDAARSIYHMPFFSILISSVSTITGLTLEYSAYLLNSILLAIMAVAFGKILSELSTDQRLLIVGVILLLAHAKINDNYRSSIIRDPGYWAFYLLAIFSYLRSWNNPRLRYYLGWGCAMIVATLFRYEGIVFLLFAPFFVFLKSHTAVKNKLRKFVGFNIVLIFTVAFTLIWKLTSGSGNALGTVQFTALGTWFSDIIPYIHQIFLERADKVSDALFNEYPYSRGYALSSILITLIIIFITEATSSLTYTYTPFSLHALLNKTFPRITGIYVITGFIIINAAIILIFLSRYLFVTGRYVIPLALLLLIFTAFSLVHLYDRWMTKRKVSFKWRWGGIFIALFLLISALDGLISTSPSKAYERQAGEWLQKNIPDTANVYTNNPGILYYSGRVRDDLTEYRATTSNIESILDDPKNKNYVAFQIKKKDKRLNIWLSSWKGVPQIMEFKNNKGDKVVIFVTNNTSSSD